MWRTVSDLDRYLTSIDLLDCQGRVEHSLTLQLDGTVRVRRGGSSIIVDPATGFVDPPGAAVPDHVIHAISELAGRPTAGRDGRHEHHRHRH